MTGELCLDVASLTDSRRTVLVSVLKICCEAHLSHCEFAVGCIRQVRVIPSVVWALLLLPRHLLAFPKIIMLEIICRIMIGLVAAIELIVHRDCLFDWFV